MSNRISITDAAKLAGVHVKTLERWAKDPDFAEATGYLKSKLNGRVSFDDNWFRIHIAAITGNDSIRAEHNEPDAIEAEEIPAGALERVQAQAVAAFDQVAGSDRQAVDLVKHLSNAFTLPAKIYLTLDEAKALTGFPKTELRKISELKFGRRVISRRKLEKI